METINCDHCGKVMGYGEGDLNCIVFACSDECREALEAEEERFRKERDAKK